MYTSDIANVYIMTPDGTQTAIATNLGGDIDMVEDSQGIVYIADTMGGTLYKIDGQGNQTPLAGILADKCNLAINNDDNLYGNNLGNGYILARIDTETGKFTSLFSENENQPCYVAGMGNFFFLSDGRMFFENLNIYNPQNGSGGPIFKDNYISFNSVQLGPDGNLYARGDRCTAEGKTMYNIVSINENNGITVMMEGKRDVEMNEFVFDDTGGLFVDYDTESNGAIYYYSGFSSPSQIISSERYDGYGVMVYTPLNEHLYALTSSERYGEEIILREFSKTGFVAAHVVSSPGIFQTLKIAIDPGTGSIYAVADEKERYETGQDVKRWIFKLDLDKKSAEIFAQHDLKGHCCPFHSITVDQNGDIW